MHLEISLREGLRNELLLKLERRDISAARLSVAHRDRLIQLPGIPRHRPATDAEAGDFERAKLTIDEHLRGLGLFDAASRAAARAVAISNRNLGANHGHLAYQRDATPRIFSVSEDPRDRPSYPCLTSWRSGGLTIAQLRFDPDTDGVRDARDGRDLSDEIDWATSGPQVLRDGIVTGLDDLVDGFYDARHLFAFDVRRPEGEAIRRRIYEDYPAQFRENLQALRREGVPRARYFHGAVGLGADALVIVQREGTVEEIGSALKDAGAADGLILDNGGSVACWAWWANQYAGGLISTTVDYRPPGTSAIAFVLKGPLHTNPPGGSVSFTVL